MNNVAAFYAALKQHSLKDSRTNRDPIRLREAVRISAWRNSEGPPCFKEFTAGTTPAWSERAECLQRRAK